MTTWITDANGNRASVEYWGSEEAARASLETLKGCRNCSDCTDCTNCSDCTNCTNCSDCKGCSRCSYCSYCSDCTDCSGCTDCDLSQPNHRLPVSDPRGYTWLAVWEAGAWRIRAGYCHFSIAEARAHWLSSNYNGPGSVKETIGWALDWITEKSPSSGKGMP